MNTEPEIAIESKTPRRWWRPQFTIVQMLLVFLIVALCVANWLLRQEIEEVRFATRFYNNYTGLDLQQIGSCTVKEIINYQHKDPELVKIDYEIAIVLNPQKNYKIFSALCKLDAFEKQLAEISELYVSKPNRHVVAKILISGDYHHKYPSGFATNNYGFITYKIVVELHESSTSVYNNEYKVLITEALTPGKLSTWYIPSPKHTPISFGYYDLSQPLSLLTISDSTDETGNSQGIHIWLEEVE